jgi:hypothetical protein
MKLFYPGPPLKVRGTSIKSTAVPLAFGLGAGQPGSSQPLPGPPYGPADMAGHDGGPPPAWAASRSARRWVSCPRSLVTR